jgi:hypothetical protein
MPDPVEVRGARARLDAARGALEEAVQVASSLRGRDESAILSRLEALSPLALEVDRAWRISLAQAEDGRQRAEAERQRLALAASSAESALQDVRARLATAEGTVQQLLRDRASATAEGEAGVRRARDEAAADTEAWKASFTAQMREYVSTQLKTARERAAAEARTTTEGALARLEEEYRSRAEAGATALQEALRLAQEGRADAREATRRADAAEARAAAAESGRQAASAALAEAEARCAELAAAAKAAAEEVRRHRRVQEVERAAHADLLRIAEMRLGHEVASAEGRAASAVASAREAGRREVEGERGRREREAREREDLVAEWRAKYAAAQQRAEAAEGLLREIDGQLVVVNGGEDGV